jgi:tetratricopeptide (TPR) repeat protein
MAEMEWEFTDDGESGQFMATGKVINILRGHLARGEVDAAVALYESCVQNVGDAIWNEFTGASVPMKKSIANLFFRARDYARSAAACENLGEWVAAGKSYEASYDYPRAAQCYLKANNKQKAAAVIEKAGDLRRAAELYYEDGDIDASAAALERAGDLLGAAQLMIGKKDLRKAAQILGQVPANDPRYLQAVHLLSEVLVRLDRRDLAIQRLASVVPRGAPIKDNATAELAYRMGRLLWETNHLDAARQVLDSVRAFSPKFRDVGALLETLSRGQSAAKDLHSAATLSDAGAVTQPVQVASVRDTLPLGGPPLMRPTTPVPAAHTDPFAALDANPFAPRSPASMSQTMPALGGGISTKVQGPPKPAETVPLGYVTRMEGYDVLKKLPIFEDLSLDEMKAFYGICDQVFYKKGDVIIEQGVKGEALIIVREGSLKVSKVDGGREIQLAMLPAGNYVGEMSLVDDAPTSARVTAAEAVKALRVRRDRFEQFLNANDRIALRVYKRFVRTISTRLRDTNARR